MALQQFSFVSVVINCDITGHERGYIYYILAVLFHVSQNSIGLSFNRDLIVSE